MKRSLEPRRFATRVVSVWFGVLLGAAVGATAEPQQRGVLNETSAAIIAPEHYAVIALDLDAIRWTLKTLQVRDWLFESLPAGAPGVSDLDVELQLDLDDGLLLAFHPDGVNTAYRARKALTPDEFEKSLKEFASDEHPIQRASADGAAFWRQKFDADSPASGFAQLDSRFNIQGEESLVRKILARRQKPEPQSEPFLSAARSLAGDEFVSVVTLHSALPRFLEPLAVLLPGDEATKSALAALRDADWCALSIRPAPLQATLRFHPKTPADAARLKAAVRLLGDYLRQIGADARTKLEPPVRAELGDKAAPAIALVDAGLKSFAVSSDESSAAIVVQFDRSLTQAVADLQPMFAALLAQREESRLAALPGERLKTIALGCQNFMTSNRGCYPRHIGVKDKKLHPNLSWRVAILPYIEFDALADQFKLDEPWDSPHNLKLVDQMPDVFKVPGVELEAGKTIVVQAVGPGTALPLDSTTGAPFPKAIVMVHKNPKKAVVWTQPDDLVVDPEKISREDLYATPHGYTMVRMNADVLVLRTIDDEKWRKLFESVRPR